MKQTTSGVPGRNEAGKPGQDGIRLWRKSVEKQLARVKERLKTLTGLTASAAVRSLLEEEAGEIVFCSGAQAKKARLSGTGKKNRPSGAVGVL